MSRLRVMQGILAGLTVVMIWSWTREPPASVLPEKMRPRRRVSPSAAPPPTLGTEAAVRRNIFEYGEASTSTAPPAASLDPLPRATPSPVEMTDAPLPLKLVGLVHQGTELRAALAVHGDIVLGAPGQDVGGYKIVSINEDSGVVLTGPDGRTIELRREEGK